MFMWKKTKLTEYILLEEDSSLLNTYKTKGTVSK